MRFIVSLALLVLASIVICVADAPLAMADDLISEIRLGALAHDVPGIWSGFRAEPAQVAGNAEILFAPSLMLFGGTLHPAFGGSFTSDGSTSNLYLDARWQYETSFGLFVGLGVGGTVHNGQLKLEDWDRKALGSRLLFHFPAEIGIRLDHHNSISAYFEHMSNAYTVSPNEGLDRLGIRYGYRF